MIINRHNYEEFFLLYVDNELSAVERTEVEAFAEQNPDLKKELELLQEATLMPEDNYEFEEKSSLYKNEQSINLSNYETYFLLNIDNELRPQERDEVEKFVLQHPELQQEFTLLQQSKLQPEVIEFKDKATLYKTEAKVRRIFPAVWMRVASAAAVIGIVAMLWISKDENKTGTEPIASVNKTEQVLKPIAPAIGTDTPQDKKEVEPNVAKQEVTIEKRKGVVEEKVNPASIDNTKKKKAVINDGNPNNLPSSENNPVLAHNRQREEGSELIARTTENLPETSKALSVDVANNKNIVTPTLATQAVYRELVEDDEEKTIYIGGAEINKNKLRGLFKKASTLLERKFKKNESDNVVQIASFEIKTK